MNSTKIKKNLREFHIWDFPDNIYILIEEKIRNIVFSKIYSYYGSKRKAAKSLMLDLKTIRDYERAFSIKHKIKHPQYISISFFKKVIHLFNQQFLNKIEKNINAISTRNGLDITNPILPIKESSSLYRIIAHILADGSASKVKHPIMQIIVNY